MKSKPKLTLYNFEKQRQEKRLKIATGVVLAFIFLLLFGLLIYVVDSLVILTDITPKLGK